MADLTRKEFEQSTGIMVESEFKYFLYVRFHSPYIGGKPDHKLYKFLTDADRQSAISELHKTETVDFYCEVESELF